MEKRISFFHFQSVKSVAKAIDPHTRSMEALKKKALALKEEYNEKQAKVKQEFEEKAAKIKQEFDACETQINALEAGILQMTGFHVADLVKKVIEPTGKTDAKTGKPIKITKYVPTDIVSYDDTTKEFIINSDNEQPAEETVPPTTEDVAGSDYDKDAETLETHEEESEREAAESEAENLPWA